jgi:hypothetical protein
METLGHSLPGFETSEITRRQQIFRPVAQRLQADDRLMGLMITKMGQNPSPTEKATLSRLIAQARGAEAIRTWCVNELTKQTLPTTASEIGVDISIGDFVPVTHVLLDILNDQYEPHQNQFLD